VSYMAAQRKAANDAAHAMPQRNKWERMVRTTQLARYAKPTELAWAIPGRSILLPFAVGAPDGYADFHVAKSDGCSSLLPMTQDVHGSFRSIALHWQKCGKLAAVRRVPHVSLGTILDRWLPGRTIDYLKIDAQGYDLSVVLSAPPSALARVRALEMEVTSDDVQLPYVGVATCAQIVGNMTALGFVRVDDRRRRLDRHVCDEHHLHGPVKFSRDPVPAA